VPTVRANAASGTKTNALLRGMLGAGYPCGNEKREYILGTPFPFGNPLNLSFARK